MRSLLSDYQLYQNLVKDPTSDVLDLSHIPFITPTILLPSLHFARENSQKIRVSNLTSDYIKRVLGLVSGPRTTLPFRRLPEQRTDNNELVVELLELLQTNYDGSNYGGSQTLYHLLTEMINNVIDHSNCNNAYTYAQRYPRAGIIDVAFFDDGITIPGSYEDANIGFKHDCDAINKAINGVSTKEKEGDDPRGLGINTTAQLVLRGNRGTILIASRKGLFHLTQHRKDYKRLNRKNLFNGTLVCLRVRKNQVQNFYKYMDYDPI